MPVSNEATDEKKQIAVLEGFSTAGLAEKSDVNIELLTRTKQSVTRHFGTSKEIIYKKRPNRWYGQALDNSGMALQTLSPEPNRRDIANGFVQ